MSRKLLGKNLFEKSQKPIVLLKTESSEKNTGGNVLLIMSPGKCPQMKCPFGWYLIRKQSSLTMCALLSRDMNGITMIDLVKDN